MSVGGHTARRAPAVTAGWPVSLSLCLSDEGAVLPELAELRLPAVEEDAGTDGALRGRHLLVPLLMDDAEHREWIVVYPLDFRIDVILDDGGCGFVAAPPKFPSNAVMIFCWPGFSHHTVLSRNNPTSIKVLSPHNDTYRHEYQKQRDVERSGTHCSIPELRRPGAYCRRSSRRTRDYTTGRACSSRPSSRARGSKTKENRCEIGRLVVTRSLGRLFVGFQSVRGQPPNDRPRSNFFPLDESAFLHLLEAAMGGLLCHAHHFSELRRSDHRIGAAGNCPQILDIAFSIVDPRHLSENRFRTTKYGVISPVSHLPTVTKQLYGQPLDRVKHGLRIERIGARDAALIDERTSHKNRAERVCPSPDALWGRESDRMSKELIPQSSSHSESDRKPVNTLLSSDYQGAAAVTITGPDAEDIHVVGGEE